MSFKKSFFKNLLIVGGYRYAGQIISFLSSLVTARLLFPEEYGLVGLITVFSGFIGVFIDSGISDAIIRTSYGNRFHRGVQYISWGIGFFLAMLMAIMAYPVSVFYGDQRLVPVGLAISGLFILRAHRVVPMAILRKKMEFGYLGKVSLILTVLNVLGTIILAYLGFSYWSLIWPQYAALLVVNYFYSKRVKMVYVKPTKALIFKSFHITKSLLGNLFGFNLINYWSRNADNLVVGKYYGASDLGIYSRGYSILTLSLTMISGVFTQILLPTLTKQKKVYGNIESEYYFSLKMISIINAPVGLILILFSDEFVYLLWGERWMSVSPILPFFGLLLMTQSLLSTVGSVLIIEGKEREMMFSGWVSAFFMIGGILIGAFISFRDVAAFYSLFYIIGVLGFNVYYVFYLSLNHSWFWLSYFWLPKILVSVIIWIGIYFDQSYVVFLAALFWLLVILFDVKRELIYGFKKIKMIWR